MLPLSASSLDVVMDLSGQQQPASGSFACLAWGATVSDRRSHNDLKEVFRIDTNVMNLNPESLLCLSWQFQRSKIQP